MVRIIVINGRHRATPARTPIQDRSKRSNSEVAWHSFAAPSGSNSTIPRRNFFVLNAVCSETWSELQRNNDPIPTRLVSGRRQHWWTEGKVSSFEKPGSNPHRAERGRKIDRKLFNRTAITSSRKRRQGGQQSQHPSFIIPMNGGGHGVAGWRITQ